MEGVINHLKLDYSYKELAGKLTVENPQNTRILSLTVRDENPYMAKQIVDDIAKYRFRLHWGKSWKWYRRND